MIVRALCSLRMTRTLGTLAASFLALLVTACPPADKKDPAPSKASSASEPCTKFGQTCEVSPGKLGTCVTKDGCTEAQPSCFVCQSQH